MHPLKQHCFQFFVCSPELQIQSEIVNLARNSVQTLEDLKSSLVPETIVSSFYFTLNGKPLLDSTTIPCSLIPPLSTLILRTRVLGGGGDGGATGAESRDCYLNMYAEKKPDKVDPNEQRLSKWLNCALSNEPLREPCVIDWLGNIFNKESLVQALLEKKLPKGFGHIKGLKDMIKINLSVIPGTESSRNAISGSRFQCPITGLEFNGKYKFFALRTCGHVLSAKALKEVKSSSCLVCHAEFLDRDKFVINGSEEEVAEMRERMEEEKSKSKPKEKKTKKVRNGEVGMDGDATVELAASCLSGKKHGIEVKALEKVSAKPDRHNKRPDGGVQVKVAASNGAVKRFKAADMAPANATKEVYASIFTSSKKSDFKETYSCRSLPLGRN
ncbi:protein RTF2 homolog [Cucurbita moschata]|uniref:Protein RTF2 homolog n=1 Tax=Cucurbita moschata TaxID=3662 RepID=A0A6J1E7I8_CUCMO|nr:protein RTF2 homolog [Cucurbita moschata]